MSNTVLSLKTQAANPGPESGRRRKIERSQWPEIVARRNEGASQARIAEEYGVSQGTISQILKQAAAGNEAEAASDAGADADSEAPPAGVDGAPANDRQQPDPTPAADPAPAAERDHSTPLADRLREAAGRCADLLASGTASEEDVARAAHEVRRALAAAEIGTAKRASPPAPVQRTQSAEPSGPETADEHFGRIKFFKPEKGFGFILPDDGGKDVFLGKDTAEAAGLEDLSEGDRVAYQPGPGSKGTEAKTVRLAS